MEYKRFSIYVLGGAICILVAVASFCYRVDPGNIFRNVLVETCGEWLLKGHDVSITQNYDERLLQKYLIEYGTKNYDILVLGSSRTMDIGSNLFEQRSIQNYSVSGASIEDDIALYFLYERLHGKPKEAIIGGDAWLFNLNSGQGRWKSVAKEYEYGKRKLARKQEPIFRIESVDWEKYAQLISWPYFNESINKAKKGKLSNSDGGYRLADDRSVLAGNAQIKCSDGSIIRSVELLKTDSEPKARQYISGDVYSLEGYDELDVGLEKQFKLFVAYLKSQGIDIVLYLPPYHPIVYSYLAQNDKYQNALEAETFFRKVATEYGIKVVGSYDPEQCELSSADFLDGMHMRREAVERILRGKL